MTGGRIGRSVRDVAGEARTSAGFANHRLPDRCAAARSHYLRTQVPETQHAAPLGKIPAPVWRWCFACPCRSRLAIDVSDCHAGSNGATPWPPVGGWPGPVLVRGAAVRAIDEPHGIGVEAGSLDNHRRLLQCQVRHGVGRARCARHRHAGCGDSDCSREGAASLPPAYPNPCVHVGFHRGFPKCARPPAASGSWGLTPRLGARARHARITRRGSTSQ